MSEWNFTDFASKDNLLRTVRQHSDQMLALASAPGAWEAPTASGHWQVRDIVGHLVDTTEGYFAGFDVANGKGTAPDALGVPGMNKHVDEGALAFRGTSQDEMITRFDKDRAEMFAIMENLGADEWGGFIVPHKYMGPLLDGDAAELLVPFCFIVWQSTADCAGVDPFTVGVRLSGHNGGDTRASVTADGLALEPGDVSDLPVVLEFDPASFVLTAMGRINGGTARGDAALAERFCNLFFRI